MLRGRGEGVREAKADTVGGLEVEEERTVGVNGIRDDVDGCRRVEDAELMDAITEVGRNGIAKVRENHGGHYVLGERVCLDRRTLESPTMMR